MGLALLTLIAALGVVGGWGLLGVVGYVYPRRVVSDLTSASRSALPTAERAR